MSKIKTDLTLHIDKSTLINTFTIGVSTTMIDPPKISTTTTIKKMVSTVINRGIVTRGGLSS